MSDDDTQDATKTTADTTATTDQASATPPAVLYDTAETAGTADVAEGGARTVEAEAEPAPPAKPWANTDSLDVHVKLEHLWAWAQAEMAKLHDRIDALIGGQGQNVEEPPPAKEA